MSEEERKKAYEFLQELEKNGYRYSANGREIYIVENVFNKIDKLQKENLEQKKQLESRYYHTINARELEQEINNNWEEKIKAEIKELEEMNVSGELFETAVNFAIRVLKELLNS